VRKSATVTEIMIVSQGLFLLVHPVDRTQTGT